MDNWVGMTAKEMVLYDSASKDLAIAGHADGQKHLVLDDLRGKRHVRINTADRK